MMSDVQTVGRQLALKRISYLVRHYLSSRLFDVAKGATLEAAAEMMADRLAVYVRAQVLGQQKTAWVDVQAPDGRWQALRMALGLTYRTRRIRFDAFQLFPDLEQKDMIPGLGRVVTILEHSEPKNDGEKVPI